MVPWRPGCPQREAVWEFVRQLYAERHPTWQVIEGRHEDGEWCKGEAIRSGLRSADGEILVVADADIWTDGLPRAVAAVAAAEAVWAIPHHTVYRLDEASTAAWLKGSEGPFSYTQHPYKGYGGGGAMVLRRAAYDVTPIDPRFRGWGQEDSAWDLALQRIHGRGWRGRADLLHGFHEPQPRLNRLYGSEASQQLLDRYSSARSAEDMAALLAEVTDGEDEDRPQQAGSAGTAQVA